MEMPIEWPIGWLLQIALYAGVYVNHHNFAGDSRLKCEWQIVTPANQSTAALPIERDARPDRHQHSQQSANPRGFEISQPNYSRENRRRSIRCSRLEVRG